MPKYWNERTPVTTTPVRNDAKTMPYVSEEFMSWLRGVMIPEIVPFDGMTAEGALKQQSFSNGILFLKTLIYREHERNKGEFLMPGEVTRNGQQ